MTIKYAKARLARFGARYGVQHVKTWAVDAFKPPQFPATVRAGVVKVGK